MRPSGEPARWVVPLLLLLAVLAPAACVLWFMNLAVNNQRDASRRQLAEAYRGQLTLLRARVDSDWQQRIAGIARVEADTPAPSAFQSIVEQHLADSVVLLDADGSAAYPAAAKITLTDPLFQRPDWMAARALESWNDPKSAASAYASIVHEEPDASIAARAAQAQIRCLIRAGDNTAALQAINDHFTTGRLMQGADLAGRMIAADEQLLAVHLAGPAAEPRLRALLTNYAAPMLAAQRIFLMQELGGDFPTLEAERLAARFLETGRTRPAEPVLEPAGLPDVWRLSTPAGRAIALYRGATILSAVRDLASGSNLALQVTPPSAIPPAGAEWMGAGAVLPGWQISISPADDDSVAGIVQRQKYSYLLIALCAIAVVAAITLLAARAFRRQWQLARLKTDLVAAVSHELKPPLASMRLLVDALLDDELPDSRKTHEYLQLISRENLRLSRLIENFLTFSRLERNRRKFDFATASPDQIVEATLAAAEERLPECSLGVDVAPGLPEVNVDEDAMVTVLLNLLDNAYKYTPAEKRIRLRVSESGASVAFAVEDNGIGIAPRDQKRIFRRFYQVDQRLARESGGCGLGLSIVDFLVRAHGGRVQVQSQLGQGSTVSVLLPPIAARRKGAAA